MTWHKAGLLRNGEKEDMIPCLQELSLPHEPGIITTTVTARLTVQLPEVRIQDPSHPWALSIPLLIGSHDPYVLIKFAIGRYFNPNKLCPIL